MSVHLGGSSSLCAIRDGRSIATSMGATPQSGLFHNNRVGDLDVFCLPVIIHQTGGVEAAMKALSGQSGLLGLSGVSNDMRKVEEAAAQGNERAQLAIGAFADEIVGYIACIPLIWRTGRHLLHRRHRPQRRFAQAAHSRQAELCERKAGPPAQQKRV